MTPGECLSSACGGRQTGANMVVAVSSSTIFVRNLPYDVSDEQVRAPRAACRPVDVLTRLGPRASWRSFSNAWVRSASRSSSRKKVRTPAVGLGLRRGCRRTHRRLTSLLLTPGATTSRGFGFVQLYVIHCDWRAGSGRLTRLSPSQCAARGRKPCCGRDAGEAVERPRFERRAGKRAQALQAAVRRVSQAYCSRQSAGG